MSLLRSKTVIQLSAWMLILITAAGWLWVIQAPVSVAVPDPADAPLPAVSAPADANERQLRKTDIWSRLFARRLQRPLFDPPPKELVVEEKKPPPPPAIQIIATMPEPSGGHAMVQDEQGRVAVLPVGAVITAANADVKLVAIYDGHVELEYAGETITMKLKTN